jgi:hypothetical protein
MPRKSAILLGIASWLPLASLAIFYVWWTGPAGTEATFETLPAAVIALALAMLLGLILVLFYLLRIVRDPAMHAMTKLVWVIALSAVGVFALPVYWYLHVWEGAGRTSRPRAEPPSLVNSNQV